MKKALPGLVPDRFLKANLQAFDKGYVHGLAAAGKSPDSAQGGSAALTNGAVQ
jgi:hypothetical protein